MGLKVQILLNWKMFCAYILHIAIKITYIYNQNFILFKIMIKNTSLSFVALIIFSLMCSCSSKMKRNSDLAANVTAFVSNTDQIVGFGYIDIEKIKEKSQIAEIHELKKVLKKTLGLIEGAVKLNDKVYYAFAGPIKGNGPEVNYAFVNVGNKDSLQNVLEMMGFFFKESNENSNIKIYDDESIAIGFDDNTLVIVAANFDHDPKDLLLNAFTSFNMKKKKDIEEVFTSENDILLAADLEHLYSNASSFIKDLPEDKRTEIEDLVKGGIWTLGIQFNEGNLTAKMDISKVNDQLKALYLLKDKSSGEIQQNLGPDTSNFAMTLSLNMDHVESLLNLLGEKQEQDLFELLGVPLIVKGLIASEGLSGLTNGNIGAMIGHKKDDQPFSGLGMNNKHFFLGLGKKSQNMIDLVGTLAEADQIHDMGDGYYQIEEGGILRLNKNNLIYHANDSSKEDFKTGPIKMDSDVAHFGDQPLSIYMNLQDENRNTLIYGMPKPISHLFNYATLQGDNDGFTLKIMMKNKDENILKQILDAFKQEVIQRVGNNPMYN